MTNLIYLQMAFLLFTGLVAAFCLVLARRIRKLNDLENGLGGAIAVMAIEIDRLERAMQAAKGEATTAGQSLIQEIARAKEERAYWILQGSFSQKAVPAGARSLRRKRREAEDAA